MPRRQDKAGVNGTMPLVPRRPPFQLFRQESPADPDVELGGYTSDDDNTDIDHNPEPSASNTPSVDSNSDSDSSGDILDDKVADDESQRDISWALDSDDQDEDEVDQQDPAQRHIPDSQSSEHGFGDYYASDENDDLLDESVLADDRSGSSETVFQAFEGGESPSPRPSPPLHYHQDYDSEPHAPSRPGLITISDTEAESEQSEPSPGTLSPQSAGSSPAAAAAAGFLASASSSQGSRLGPSGPLDREPFRRRRRPRPDLHGPQSDVEEDVDFYNVPPSTRRPSLTPVLQPNRRLPRHSPSPAIARYQDFDDNPAINDLLEEEWNIQQSPPANAANAAYHNFDDLVGLSDSSEDEPLVQRPHRYLGIERTRRPRPLVIIDHSDESISDDEVNRLDHLPNSHRQRIPNIRHNENNHSVQGSDSDHVQEEQPDDRNEEELDREFWPGLDLVDEELRDSSSQSDQEDLPDNLSLSEESQADESGVEQSSIQSGDSESEEDDDDVDEAFRDAVLRQEQQQRRDAAFPPLDAAAVVRETAHRLEQSLARLAERPDLQARFRRVAYGLGMDGDDDLVEMLFHDVDERQRLPRQNSARQNNQAPNNHGRLVEVIDLTEEPDSPLLHHRDFQNADLGNNRRHRSRTMAQNGRQPPSLPRNPGDFQVIDLTGDDNPVDVDAAYPDSDDDDGLFVRQHGHIHIPANRRLPHPVPPPVPFHRRFGNVRRYLAAAFPGMPGLQGEDDAFGIGPGPPYGINPNPLADNPPEFNYQANGFAGRPQPPKPQFEEPPAARPGFTRNTGPDPVTGEDQVFVCASCDNELMYHEDSEDERPAKKAKTKKDREEHHFWAVKVCGHVYCTKCYEGRRKVKMYGPDIRFPFEQVSSSKAKIFCAVDDCNSDVSNNNSWVGIFM